MPGLTSDFSRCFASSTSLTRMARIRDSMCETDQRNWRKCSAMLIASELSVRRQGPTATNSEASKAGRSAVDCLAEVNMAGSVTKILAVTGPIAEESTVTEVDMEETRQGFRTLPEEIGLRNTTSSMRAQQNLPHDGERKLQPPLRSESRSK